MSRFPLTGARLTALLTAIVAFGPLSTDLYLPSLPAMTGALDATVSQVQLTLSVFIAALAVAMPVHGPLADRFGRRPVLLWGLALYAVGSLGCVLAPSVEALLVARGVQALGGCAGAVVGRAVVRDLFEREEAARRLSYMASAMAVTPMLAPTLGGWIQVTVGWRGNFVVMLGLGVVLWGVVWRWLPETGTPQPAAVRQAGRTYGHLLGSRAFLRPALAVGTIFAGLFAFISGVSFTFVDALGVSVSRLGLYFGAVVAGYITGSLLSGRYGRRVGLARMVRLGGGLCAGASVVLAGLVLVAPLPPAPLLAAVIAVWFLATGLVLPNATAMAIAPFPTRAGAASALLGVFQMLGGAVTGALVGALFAGTAQAMGLMMAAMGALTLWATWVAAAESE